MLAEHKKTVDEALAVNVKKDDAPKFKNWGAEAKKEADLPGDMRTYLKYNTDLYNPSQTRVLEKVIDMPENDILLIQGPPGTGKTHTITGIISMLVSTGPKKILICAPSNAAVDEIVTRVAQHGFVGRGPGPDTAKIEKMLLRIGSMEYEPSPVVKKHTLDERLLVEQNGNKIYWLKARVATSAKLLAEMA